MSKEYTYEIDKYTIGVDENGEDGIGLTIAIIKNGEINFLGNCYGENARCIDLLIKENKELKKHLKVPKACNLKTLEDYKSYYEDATKEQILEDTYIEYCAYVNLAHRYSKLKKQLEEYQLQNINLREDIMIQKIAFPNKLIKDKTFYDLYDMPTYEELLAQQKEFIKWLENGIEKVNNTEFLDERIQRAGLIAYNRCLQKYKEIIGNDINVGSKGENK